MNRAFILLRAEWPLLAFGFLMAFGSSAGQTFFISWFSAGGGTFDLGHGGFGSLYSAATLVSGFLIWAGLIDRVDLRRSLVWCCPALCWRRVSRPATGPVSLLLALFLLRFLGQGLEPYGRDQCCAPRSSKGAGQGGHIATLGFPVGEGLCPILVVAATQRSARPRPMVGHR